jgi:glycosyltransferase involved in cell wall biosynthesis
VALVGSSGAARGTDLLVRACERARRQWPNLRLLLALNDSGGLGNLAELRGRFGASRWISFERVNYEQLPAFLNRVTIGAVPHPRSEYLDLALPMKLFDYMSAARPVVSTDCPAAAKILEAHDAGVVCGAEPDALAGAISLVLGDRRRAHKLGLNGRRAIEVEHNWDHALAPLATTIQRALRQHD